MGASLITGMMTTWYGGSSRGAKGSTSRSTGPRRPQDLGSPCRITHLASRGRGRQRDPRPVVRGLLRRSEEHTSELQSHSDLVCRLLLEKKKKTTQPTHNTESDQIK